ncbi:hypothetical protein KFL_004600160 [Klebsormidium nitens]|uniref:Uncharacterized protein n=1 Tax=Klebsormidium nitens TaxID=105231 RepID=A0A1Y1ICX4_KLENI|nr:hypothetical protein KFL_004600160 [Klebsormidium nitens]|eukprot:GAQ88805.1 hypothetical protein KFL_004600160 [Klebsormidium nitens]
MQSRRQSLRPFRPSYFQRVFFPSQISPNFDNVESSFQPTFVPFQSFPTFDSSTAFSSKSRWTFSFEHPDRLHFHGPTTRPSGTVTGPV